MYIKNLLLFILIGINCISSFAQLKVRDDRGIKVNLFTGHHFAANLDRYNHSLDGNVFGLDLGLVQYGLKKSNFTEIYGNPLLGLDFRFIKMNHTDTFGYSIGILPNIELEIIHQAKWKIVSKISFGVNLNTKQFNEKTNFDNRAISFPVNFAFDAGLSFHRNLNNNFLLNFGSGLYHVSNGSLKMPNGAINIGYINAGISYFPHLNLSNNYIKPNYQYKAKPIYYMGYFAAAYRQQGYFNYIRRFPVFAAVNQAMYRVNKLFSAGIGFDIFYDATQNFINNDSLMLSSVPESKKYFVATGFASRFDIGKLFIPVGFYTYLYNKKIVKEPIYLRFGLGYQFNKKWFCGLFFKGTITKDYKLKSDFMEWSVGMRL